MENIVKALLAEIGEDPQREGLLETPRRVKESYQFLTEGYRQDPVELIRNATFTDKYEEMVVLKDIPVYSLCEHHLMPFYGHAHVAYIPNGRIVGISKIARMVDLYARRLQVQERLTTQIAETLHEIVQPLGVGVIVEAQHLCMQMRGVQKHGATMQTSHMIGAFRSKQLTREEFLTLIRR